MGKKAERVLDELYDGYQALASAIFPDDETVSPRLIAYLDGYADAMHHAGWALDSEAPKSKHLFGMLPPKRLRKAARRELKARRGDRR